MRLTTLNLRGLFDWSARSGRIVEFLREVSPDVVLLQEVVYLPDESPWTNVELLNQTLGYPVRHAAVTRLQEGRGGRPYREGLALLSRLPVRSTEALTLLHVPGDRYQRIVQLIDVADADGADAPWLLANVHHSVNDEYAAEQQRELLAILDARGERRILAGDFNVDHLERRRGLAEAAGYTVSTAVQPYDSHPGTAETDDYVLVPAGVRITHVAVSGDGLSDHRAVTVDLERG